MKRVVVIIAAVIVCTSFSFALDDELESFDAYSFDPLTMSALDYAVMPLATAEWSTSDSQNLEDILDQISPPTLVSSPSLYTLVRDIRTNSGNIKDYLVGGSGSLSDPGSGSVLYLLKYLPNLVSLQTMEYNLDYIQEDTEAIRDYSYSMYLDVNEIDSNLDSLLSAFNYAFSDISYSMGYIDENGNYQHVYDFGPTRPFDLLGYGAMSVTLDGVNSVTGRPTLYSLVRQLQQVLASDEDLALSESQKQNREEIEDSFLNGSSGSTSLGASDFGDLSDIGGTVKDSISLNGQASVSSFTEGLAGADESGQGWFSAATRDSLDSVSSSVSTFSMDDPYNMSGWHDRYAWVMGD